MTEQEFKALEEREKQLIEEAKKRQSFMENEMANMREPIFGEGVDQRVDGTKPEEREENAN